MASNGVEPGHRDLTGRGAIGGTAPPYPVTEEADLSPVRRQLLVRGRREATELPILRPGCVYVFHTNGEYVDYGERHVNPTDPAVVSATGVSVVQTRARQLPVDVVIPSASAEHEFTVRTTFRCRVVDAAEVAGAGLTDLDVVLATHLAHDSDLGTIGWLHTLDELREVERRVDAQVRAYWLVAAPDIAGMEITLTQVKVLAPPPAPAPAPAPAPPADRIRYVPNGRQP